MIKINFIGGCFILKLKLI